MQATQLPIWKAFRHTLYAPEPVNCPLNLTLLTDTSRATVTGNLLVVAEVLDCLETAGISIPWTTLVRYLPETPTFSPAAETAMLRELRAAGVISQASSRTRLVTCGELANALEKLKALATVAEAIRRLSAVQPRTIGSSVQSQPPPVDTQTAHTDQTAFRYGKGPTSLVEKYWFTALSVDCELPSSLEMDSIPDVWLKGDYGLVRKDVAIPRYAPIFNELSMFKTWCTDKVDFNRGVTSVKVS